jgi:serine phosphatase RsbU (regulator of sigma subunit)
VNAVLEEMNGQPAELLLGRTPSEVNGDVGERAEVLYRKVMDSGVAMRDVRLTGAVAARPGEARHWSTTFYPVRRDGDVVGLCVIVDDVTAEQELAQSLEESQRSHQRLAEDLQRDLLPPPHPVVPGADVAALYRPANAASRVGGDFYDVIEVDERRWLVVVGDVQGKGPLAASLSGALRYAVRTAAVIDADPDRVMATVNDVLLGLEHERTCTAVCVLLEQQGEEWSVSAVSAGHPLPLVVRGARDRSPARVEEVGAHGMLLGAVPGATYRPVSSTLAPGDTLVLYTDGITETRAPLSPRPGEVAPGAAVALFGRPRLHALLAEASSATDVRSAAGGWASRLAAVVGDAVDVFAEGAPRDDVTLLAFHVPGTGGASVER